MSGFHRSPGARPAATRLAGTAALAAALACAVATPLAFASPAAQYPATAKRPVSDTFHGVSVSEDHRWLENGASAEVTAWALAQQRLTRSVLDGLPQRASLAKELAQMIGGNKAMRHGFELTAGQVFALKRQPPKNQDLLVVMNASAETASERVLLDPNLLDKSGKTTIDWFKASPDGRLVAVSLSRNGSEDGALHIYRTDNGKALPDLVPRVQFATAGGSVAWTPDAKGLYYTRYPQGQERPPADANFYQQVYFHRLGTPAQRDEYVLGRDFPRIAETVLASSDDGHHLLADVSNGDGGEHAFWLRSRGENGSEGAWRLLAGFEDGLRAAQFGRDGKLYGLALKGSPRGRIVAMSLADPAADLRSATTVVPESEAVIEAFAASATRLTVEALLGGPTELRRYTLAGEPLGTLPAPAASTNLIGLRLKGDELLIGSQSFTRAFSWLRLDSAAAEPKPQPTDLAEPPAFAQDGGLPGVEAVREWAVSKDGTKVPMTIVRRIGTPLDGKQPVLLTGYGGFGISEQPRFKRDVALWLRHGGVYVQANLRGGGEFGETWHQGGMLTRKQNVFDDMIGAAEALIKLGYTTPERLAIQGGSNGGLLMGAVTTQRPELFRAVVSQVGLYDMMRVENTSNGAFNVTEFGSVKDPAQFKAMLAYSPLHQVKDGTRYPAMLFTTGLHDGRVEPWMSFKMTARMQAANPGSLAEGRPVLLRVEADGGHGIGTSLAAGVAEQADIFAFLFSQLGMN
ncbi:prolyl oligopeptidase family serine peptidase [Ideonella azotifigens]|nr:prolyl oligopeptidase family serine peptidase [Ideonella azotifigens]MCD2341034.1 prolyl oligopeptidase family serine peptidase [Ideonella azotifigens]